MHIFIAGPLATRGERMQNVLKALTLAEQIIDLGHIPFVPHLYHYWDLYYPQPRKYWLSLDFAWLRRCDGLFRMEGESPGADAEVTLALSIPIPIYYYLGQIPKA